MDGWKGARGRESAADYLGGWKERGEGEERAGCGPEGIRAESLQGEETTEAGGLESVLAPGPSPPPAAALQPLAGQATERCPAPSGSQRCVKALSPRGQIKARLDSSISELCSGPGTQGAPSRCPHRA